MSKIGTINKIIGNVEIQKPNGQRHLAQEGESIYEGDKIITSQGSTAYVDDLVIVGNQTVLMDNNVFHSDSTPIAADSAIQLSTTETIIAALDRGQDLSTTLDATDAGLVAGDGGNHSFVMLDRILESVNPNHYEYAYNPLGIQPITEGVAVVEQTPKQTTQDTQPTDPQVPSIPSQPEAPSTPSTPTQPTDPSQPPVTQPDPKPTDPLNISDLLSDGKHELVFEESEDKDGKHTTKVHIDDPKTHKEVVSLEFDSHIDHTVQSVIDCMKQKHTVDN